MGVLKDRFWPIVLKKSVLQTARALTPENAFFARSYAKSEPGILGSKVKISISSAYFSAVETMADFFNRTGRLLPVATGRPEFAESGQWTQRRQSDDVNGAACGTKMLAVLPTGTIVFCC